MNSEKILNNFYVTTYNVDGIGDVVGDWGTGLEGKGLLIQTELESSLRDNYKVVNGKLIELTDIEKELIPIEKKEPNKMEVLEQENKILKAQVEALGGVTDFHEELIVEMANKIYA